MTTNEARIILDLRVQETWRAKSAAKMAQSLAETLAQEVKDAEQREENVRVWLKLNGE